MSRRTPGLYDMSAHDANGNTLRNDPNADKRGRTRRGSSAAENTPLDGLKVSRSISASARTRTDFGVADNPATNLSSDRCPFPSPRDLDFAAETCRSLTTSAGRGCSTSAQDDQGTLLSTSTEEFGAGSLANQNKNEFHGHPRRRGQGLHA